jgi:outer membrane protein assembly factor BamB
MITQQMKRILYVGCTILLGTLMGVPAVRADAPGSKGPLASAQVFLPIVAKPLIPMPMSGAEWPMLGANPQRTSWTLEEVRGGLGVQWYRPLEPFIPYKVQPIAANGKIYVSTSRGLYAFNATNGNLDWVYPTESPLGHSPTIATVNGRSTAYVGSYDHKLYALDALTGQPLSGYVPFEAGAGFETNPLVLNNTIYAGNRDGNFYALDAATGALKWKYLTNGPVLFSAAAQNGIVYFASNDSYAYALNATSGTLVWKSAKLSGAGFHTFWPVVYTEKASGKTYVIFTGSENFRYGDSNNVVPWPTLHQLDQQYLWGSCWPDHCPGGIIWPTGTVTGAGNYWGHDASTIDVSAITAYYENLPERHTTFVLDAATGQEFTFDSNHNGKPEYAPFTWSGVTSSGNKYPGIVNIMDQVYYQDTMYNQTNWISRGNVVGWKWGDHFVSRVESGINTYAVDEPMAYSSGGRLIYWSLCCDREAGAFDVTLPFGQPNRAWQYWAYNLNSLAPDYGALYNDGTSVYTNMDGWQSFSGTTLSKNGVYAKVETAQSAPVPYMNKVYYLKGNALLAFSPSPPAGSPAKLPMATIVPGGSSIPTTTKAQLTQTLESQVQKMLAAGPLRPGYHSAGFIDNFGEGSYTDDREFGEIFDYFQNPADTVYTLLLVYPSLSAGTQAQVKTYLQTYYGPGTTYDFTQVVHIGWGSGAPREVFTTPSQAAAVWGSNYKPPSNPSTQPICGTCGYWHNFPPFSFYAAWKYAQVVGNNDPTFAQNLFNRMSGKIEAPPGDAFLTKKPYFINLYAAGYLGYLQLKQLANLGADATVQGYYNHLLALRVTNFLAVFKDTPYQGTGMDSASGAYNRTLSVARNFMFLTPELADWMRQNIPSGDVQTALNEYTTVAPYWFVGKFDASWGEGTLDHLYNVPALFQAKAYLLKQPYSELVKWLDVPSFDRGDLFYLQNLAAALAAP